MQISRKRLAFIVLMWVGLLTYLSTVRGAAFTVDNLNDSGAGSLRQAVLDANGTGGADTITFTVSGTIMLTSGQITITDAVTIDGAGQTVTLTGNARIFQVNSGVSVEINNLTFSNTAGVFQGGAILNNGTLTINDAMFSGNSGSAGGAIFTDGTLIIDDSTFANNTATNVNTGGGAIYNNSGNLTITDSSLYSNQANGSGGAIQGGGTTNISTSTIAGNTAARYGGGIISITGTLTISRSTISGNTATADEGGGIYSSGTLNLSNSTISGNQAGTNGGGLIVSDSTITSSTITGNTASSGGNIQVFGLVSSVANISSTILNNGSCAITTGTLADGGNNLQFNASGCVGTTGNPQLHPLGNYGGTTQTHALDVTSAALNQYTTGCPAIDQRGVARPQEVLCDIGAFEGTSASPTSTPTLTPTFTPTATATNTALPQTTIITENEFFSAVVDARQGYPDIITIVPDFVPNAINMTIAISGGTVGHVQVSVASEQGYVAFTIDLVTVNGVVAPPSYINIINRDLPNILTAALDDILTQRFGSGFDVRSITLTGTSMTVAVEP